MRVTYIKNEQEKRKLYTFDRLTHHVRYLHEMLAKPSDTKFEYKGNQFANMFYVPLNVTSKQTLRSQRNIC